MVLVNLWTERIFMIRVRQQCFNQMVNWWTVELSRRVGRRLQWFRLCHCKIYISHSKPQNAITFTDMKFKKYLRLSEGWWMDLIQSVFCPHKKARLKTTITHWLYLGFDTAQSVFGKHEGLRVTPKHKERNSSMVTEACNPSTGREWQANSWEMLGSLHLG